MPTGRQVLNFSNAIIRIISYAAVNIISTDVPHRAPKKEQTCFRGKSIRAEKLSALNTPQSATSG